MPKSPEGTGVAFSWTVCFPWGVLSLHLPEKTCLILGFQSNPRITLTGSELSFLQQTTSLCTCVHLCPGNRAFFKLSTCFITATLVGLLPIFCLFLLTVHSKVISCGSHHLKELHFPGSFALWLPSGFSQWEALAEGEKGETLAFSLPLSLGFWKHLLP